MVASTISWRVAPLGGALALLPEADRRHLLACFALVRLAMEADNHDPGDSPPLRAAICARLTLAQVFAAHPDVVDHVTTELLALGEAQLTQRLDAADDLVARFQRLDQLATDWLTTPEAMTHWILQVASLDVVLFLLLAAAEVQEDAALQQRVRREVECLLDEVEGMLGTPPPEHAVRLEVPTPDEFVRLANVAFSERVDLAYGIAELAGRWYPEEASVAAARRLFALPVAREVPRSSDPAPRARNRAWLRAHEQEYDGQWLVLVNGQLRGHGDDLDAIADRMGGLPPGALLVRAGA